MTQPQRVRPLAEGAFLALITAILGALAIYFLPAKFMVDFIWGIPLILIIKRYDLRMGILTLMTTFFITWILTEPTTTFLLMIELAPLALAFGLLFKYETSPGTSLLVGSLVSILATFLTVIGFFYIGGVSIFPAEEALRMQAEQTVSVYAKLGLINEAQVKPFIDTSVKLMITIFPSVLAFGSIIRAFFTYVVAVRVLKKLNYKVRPLPPFRDWKLPWYSVWLVIIGLGLSILGDEYQISTVASIGKNMIFIIMPVFFLIGVAVAANFFHRWKMPSWAKILVFITGLINFSGTIVVFTLIGLFDPVISFRRRRKPEDV